MVTKSTYFCNLAVFSTVFLCSCVLQPLSENYDKTAEGYDEARRREIANSYIEETKRQAANRTPTSTAVQNPNNVPVIINDPFAYSNSLALRTPNGGLGQNNVYLQQPQGGNPYSSLANSEGGVITPNIMMQNSTGFVPYQQPTFGSNYYRPY